MDKEAALGETLEQSAGRACSRIATRIFRIVSLFADCFKKMPHLVW
jgi:hypothetical protein